MPKKRMSTRLRALIECPKITVAPQAHTALFAMMIEKAGFEAMHIAGNCYMLRGWPNAGLLSYRDIMDDVTRIVRAVDIPALADAETGFGSAINVWYTTREFILAGAGGIHIEDQEFPPRSGTLAGRRVVSVDEAVGKFCAAMDAKKDLDPDFVICARTDACGAEGGSVEEAIRRANIYKKEAGVDCIDIEGIQSWEDAKRVLKEVEGPVFCVLHDVVDPHPTLEEQEAAGQCLATGGSQGGFYEYVAKQAAWEALHDFKERGIGAVQDWLDSRKKNKRRMPSNPEFFDMPHIRRLEQQFLPSALQRDYAKTSGAMPDGAQNRPVRARRAPKRK